MKEFLLNTGESTEFFFHLPLRINKNDLFHILEFFHENRQAHREVGLRDSVEKGKMMVFSLIDQGRYVRFKNV